MITLAGLSALAMVNRASRRGLLREEFGRRDLRRLRTQVAVTTGVFEPERGEDLLASDRVAQRRGRPMDCPTGDQSTLAAVR